MIAFVSWMKRPTVPTSCSTSTCEGSRSGGRPTIMGDASDRRATAIVAARGEESGEGEDLLGDARVEPNGHHDQVYSVTERSPRNADVLRHPVGRPDDHQARAGR